MQLTLTRTLRDERYTFGKLCIDGAYVCDTLEDTDRGLTQDTPVAEIIRRKVAGQTAIPTGTYHIDMDVVSPKFKDKSWAKPYGGKLPRLLSVPGFEGVLIHPGNYTSDTEGCILPGTAGVPGFVSSSVAAFQRVMDILKTNPNNLIITIK